VRSAIPPEALLSVPAENGPMLQNEIHAQSAYSRRGSDTGSGLEPANAGTIHRVDS